MPTFLTQLDWSEFYPDAYGTHTAGRDRRAAGPPGRIVQGVDEPIRTQGIME
jgi:hypothetical protein